MSKALSDVTRDAMTLPPGQRRTLARILIEVSEKDHDYSPAVDAVWEDEIVRRLHAVGKGTARARSADEVFAELDRRFGR